MTALPRGIRRRGDSFYVDVTLQGRRRTGTASTLAAAKELQTTLRAALINGEVKPKAKGWTLGEAFDRTRSVAWDGMRSEKTALLNGTAAIDYFGRTMPLGDIDTNAIDSWVAALIEKRNSNATINRKLSALGKMMTVAVERDGLERKPKMPKRKEPTGRTRYLTEDEERDVEFTLAQWGARDLSDALVVLLDTGLRLGELLRITVADVSGTALTVWINKADLPRTIPMTKRVQEVVARRARFTGQGTPLFDMHARTLQMAWNRVRYHVPGLEDVTLHTMRHTCASRLVQRGVGLPVVQQWMGHKTIQVTLRYAHLSPTNLAEACAALEQRV